MNAQYVLDLIEHNFVDINTGKLQRIMNDARVVPSYLSFLKILNKVSTKLERHSSPLVICILSFNKMSIYLCGAICINLMRKTGIFALPKMKVYTYIILP